MWLFLCMLKFVLFFKFCPIFLPLFLNFLTVSHCLTDASTRGIALVPKLALDVISCEVVRVLQLTDSCIVPISYQVPRKVSPANNRFITSTYILISFPQMFYCLHFCTLFFVFSEFWPGVSWWPLPRYGGHDSSHVCCGVVEGREQTGNRTSLTTA